MWSEYQSYVALLDSTEKEIFKIFTLSKLGKNISLFPKVSVNMFCLDNRLNTKLKNDNLRDT